MDNSTSTHKYNRNKTLPGSAPEIWQLCSKNNLSWYPSSAATYRVLVTHRAAHCLTYIHTSLLERGHPRERERS